MEEFAFVLDIHHPDVLLPLLRGIVGAGEVVRHTADGRTVFRVILPNWLVDELTALGADQEEVERDDPVEQI
jgi:hypothetical protein